MITFKKCEGHSYASSLFHIHISQMETPGVHIRINLMP